jgi:hypothetical protein
MVAADMMLLPMPQCSGGTEPVTGKAMGLRKGWDAVITVSGNWKSLGAANNNKIPVGCSGKDWIASLRSQ